MDHPQLHYCTNSSKKGHQMCRFPTELKRRKVWIKNTNRSDWVPGVNADMCEVQSRICEIHPLLKDLKFF